MDSDGLLGCLIVVGLIIGAIYLIVKYVVPVVLAAGAVALAICTLVGAVIGFGYALANFWRAVITVIKERKALAGYRDQNAKDKYSGNGNKQSFAYEDAAAHTYFFGPCFRDVWNIVVYSFKANFASVPDFSRGENWLTRVLFIVLSLVQLIVTYLLGTVFTLALSLFVLGLFLVVEIPVLVITGIVLFFETLYFKSRQISYRCPACKHEYNTPIYECPKCSVQHTRLCPGAFGILRRRCLCDTRLPVSVRVHGWYYESNASTGRYKKHKFRFSELKSYCCYCKTEHNAGLSKPTSIALIGGASAGKTTFKVAFVNDFLTEEMGSYNIDVGFPDESLAQEYDEMLECYKGRRLIMGTGKGMVNDISTFSFFLDHKKFSASRMIHIYDMPGETFESGDAKEGWDNYTFTEGAVFLVDPYSIPAIRAEQQNDVDFRAMAVCSMHMDRLNDSLIDTLRQVKVKKRNGRFMIPIALTINKVDTPFLKKIVGTEAVDNLMRGRPDVFSDYFVAMDYVCRCFLARYGGVNFIANLDNHFETVHFFFSSPMGYVPKATRTRFYPINVLPVMQWLMMRADKQLGRAWTPEAAVRDLTDEQRSLYLTHPEYYDECVLSVLNLQTVRN